MMKPFELSPDHKKAFILKKMEALTEHHVKGCTLYRDYIASMNFKCRAYNDMTEIPYLPARFFKEFDLRNTGADVEAVANSSGTSGDVSKISLSKKTMLSQSIALDSIVASFIGREKRPILIFESDSIISNKKKFNARAAGVFGFAKFGNELFFALDDLGHVNQQQLDRFVSAVEASNSGLVFGFTSTVWNALQNCKSVFSDAKLKNLILIHGGGWKKLAALNISDADFQSRASDILGVSSVHNYYGMVEQTGSIFFQCEHGSMHASKFSEVLARDENSLQPCLPGEPGVLQVFSSLPESYPGHSILTEDVGVVEPDRLCSCGRFGSTVRIYGRLEDSEVRGCSDVYL